MRLAGGDKFRIDSGVYIVLFFIDIIGIPVNNNGTVSIKMTTEKISEITFRDFYSAYSVGFCGCNSDRDEPIIELDITDLDSVTGSSYVSIIVVVSG